MTQIPGVETIALPLFSKVGRGSIEVANRTTLCVLVGPLSGQRHQRWTRSVERDAKGQRRFRRRSPRIAPGTKSADRKRSVGYAVYCGSGSQGWLTDRCSLAGLCEFCFFISQPTSQITDFLFLFDLRQHLSNIVGVYN